ncbi:hypothetical protein ACVRZR_07780 [Streptococcus entericus]|uniref:hypothetical protein n=1 Tax=Streptococcus entericus TaxID=155680 RepID=UPI00035FE987|nr:hypothetical protein [Streptococcus entericus]
MTKKKVDRLSVTHRREIRWLQWYFLKDKTQPNKTILESKIENAMLLSNFSDAKRYIAIKTITASILEITDEPIIRTIKEVFVFQRMNMIGACQRILYLSPTAAYNRLTDWFNAYFDKLFELIPLNQ